MILGAAGPMVALTARPRGVALIGGRRDAELVDPLRTVGALLDAGWVHPKRTGRAHLGWLARAGGLAKGRVDAVLESVGLAGVADKKAGTYSLGMSQRLGIAATLLGDPTVLIFDEPVNGLDADGIRWFRLLAQGLAAEGRRVLVSSHLLAEMAQTASELVVIGRGRLLALGSTLELATGTHIGRHLSGTDRQHIEFTPGSG